MNYEIRINKYRKEDLILTNKGIYIIGEDISAAKLRVPKLNSIKKFIIPNQIAEDDNYIYIPNDQIPNNDMIYKFTEPLSTWIWKKYQWKNFKTKYQYKGRSKQ